MMKSNRYLALAAILATAIAAPAQSTAPVSVTGKAILTATGKGVQIYTCQQVSNSPQWVFQAPEATLTDAAGKIVATHGAGPIWKSTDGSTVKGEVAEKTPSPEPAAIPWLLLTASTTTGTGVMSKVAFIRRSDTHGGIAPTTGCDAQHLNAVSRVPYTATYIFYSKP
jgi:hypothetical protein